ncbi:MAG: stage IV sporulation protein A [Firmicutes bacterium]|nr:stage IV sporulation protein A [Bacillota bacterium]
MEKFDLFKDITERTGGDIYLGVVGPVRTGKSTFIKRFMELLVLPNIGDAAVKNRTKDELPQSGSGKTIMTTEPKFVPDEAVKIDLGEGLAPKVRLVDCVGYAVSGAVGYADDMGPRLVNTPWYDDPIPFAQAAEIGTRKVITEHSTIGLVVVTDGSITDIPRENYIHAEERVISELKELGKPFVIILNTTRPRAEETQKLAASLSAKHGVAVSVMDCLKMKTDDIYDLLNLILHEFPVREVALRYSKWLDALQPDYWLRQTAYEAGFEQIETVGKVNDTYQVAAALKELDFITNAEVVEVDLGSGRVLIDAEIKKDLFYEVVKDLTGFSIDGELDMLTLMVEMATTKKKYDRVAAAMAEVEEKGYGIVPPSIEDIVFEEPELFRQGGRFGIRLKAGAPSLHIIQTDLKTEVIPFVGNERQGQEMLRYLTEEFEKDATALWNSVFLGKPLHEFVEEGIQNKLYQMPENAQEKLRETLTRIVNEGSGGLICIIL